MQPRHLALAVAVAVVWGVNFVVIEIGLEGVPPLLFSALRFAVAAVPAILFLGPPRVNGAPSRAFHDVGDAQARTSRRRRSGHEEHHFEAASPPGDARTWTPPTVAERPTRGTWRYVVAVGLILGVAKFGLLFVGMDRGMPAGLSSLVLQCQVVFTLLFAVLVLGERSRRLQLAGIAVACLGMVLIAADKGLSSPLLAFGLVVAAGACWGLSNIVTRHARPPDTLRFMVWVSAVAVLPLLALSLLVEGPRADLDALRHLGWTGIGAVAYLAYAATLFGFGAWGYLLRRYDASTVAPFSLLVPIAGMAAAWLFRGEALTPLRAAAAVLVIAGMAGTAIRPARRSVPRLAPGAGERVTTG